MSDAAFFAIGLVAGVAIGLLLAIFADRDRS
jgi:uncharacterized membrane-anchored protein YhcB (DUF1043 family)